jgi:hypothetical protein
LPEPNELDAEESENEPFEDVDSDHEDQLAETSTEVKEQLVTVP